MHRYLRVTLLAFAAALAACSNDEPGDHDAAGIDAAGIDAADTGVPHTDAANDVGPPHGGRCVPEPLTATCLYRDYGTPCPVPCDLPSTCTYSVAVTWTGGYCCISNVEHFVDCTCVDGTSLCRQWAGGPPPTIPFTTCEFCNRPDAGVDAALEDAAVDDASTDEPDAAVEG